MLSKNHKAFKIKSDNTNILEEIIRKGSITTYDDTDRKIIGDIDEYNKHMDSCRMKMRRIDEIKMAYAIVYLLVRIKKIIAMQNLKHLYRIQLSMYCLIKTSILRLIRETKSLIFILVSGMMTMARGKLLTKLKPPIN